MNQDLKKILRQVFNPGNIKFNKRLTIFLICVAISTVFWLLITLSENYETSLRFPVKYSNIPQDKVIVNKLPERISIKVNSFGFTLVWYKLRSTLEPLTIDADLDELRQKSNGAFYFATSNQIDRVSDQLSDQIRVLDIYPDTIYFRFEDKVSKILPVKPWLDITFAQQYSLVDSIKITPQKVKVIGPENVMDTLKQLKTEQITLKGLAETKTISAKLFKPERSGLVFTKDEVEIKLKVDKFTEGQVEVPIEVQNKPEGQLIRLFPDKVTITYNVALGDFEKVSPGMFTAVVDYTSARPEKNNKLQVKVNREPEFVRAVKVNPQDVEYIVHK